MVGRGGRGRWTLRRRVGAIVVLLAVLTVVFGAWAGWQAWDARATALDEQRALSPASTEVEALLSSFVAQEAAVRGYALTGQPTYLAPYTRGRTQSGRLFRSLRTELAGHPVALADLGLVDARYRYWLRQVAQPEIADVRSGGTAAAGGPVATDGGPADIHRLLNAVQRVQVDVAGLVRQADAAADSELTTTFTTVVVWAGVLLLIVAVALVLLRRWINEPVEQLAGEVRMMAGGDLDRPVGSQGPPELASLGRDVEEMRRRLRGEVDELRQLRQALAEHSPLQAMLHSELASTASGAAFAGRLLPAEGVLAGDWYDVWDRGSGRMATALVDISGHGPAAGLFALKVKHLLSPPIRHGASPGDALTEAAGECGDTGEQFATGIIVEIADSTCRYANAGHPSGLVFGDGPVVELPPTGPLMCALPGSWRTEQVAVRRGDLVVLVTDGVTEARRPDGAEFGIEGVVEVVTRRDPGDSPDRVAEAIVSAVRERCRMPLKDDATVVVVRVS